MSPPTVKINYGVGNEYDRTVGEYPTLGDVLNSEPLAAEAGWPIGGVEGLVNGVKQNATYAIQPGDNVSIITKAASKAA
jgi:hypothetical protein